MSKYILFFWMASLVFFFSQLVCGLQPSNFINRKSFSNKELSSLFKEGEKSKEMSFLQAFSHASDTTDQKLTHGMELLTQFTKFEPSERRAIGQMIRTKDDPNQFQEAKNILEKIRALGDYFTVPSHPTEAPKKHQTNIINITAQYCKAQLKAYFLNH